MAPSWIKSGKSKSRLSLIDEQREGSSIIQRSETPDYTDAVTTLHQRISNFEKMVQQLESTVEQQRNNLRRKEEDESLLNKQVWHYSEQLNKSRADSDRLSAQLQARIEQMQNSDNAAHTLQWQKQELEDRFNAFNASYQTNLEELASRSNTIKALSRHNQQLQSRVADLERLIDSASERSGADLNSFYDDHARLRSAYDDLVISHEDAVSNLKAEKEARAEYHEDLNVKLLAEVATTARLNETIETLESENATFRTIVEEMEKDILELEDSHPRTLRSLLTMRLAELSLMPPTPRDGNEIFPAAQDWQPTGITSNSLDNICKSTDIQKLAKLLPRTAQCNPFYSRLKLDVCTKCSKAKFKFKSDARNRNDSLKWLNEFYDSSRFFSCCFDKVCKDCFDTHLVQTLQSNWWYRLGSTQWFPCPRDGCDEALGIRYESDLQICLGKIGGVDVDEQVNLYVKAMAFRKALEALEPRPNDEILRKSAELHQNLIAFNRMYDLFDTRFDPSMADETGCIPDFSPGTIHFCDMDEGDPIPLFMRFLRRQARPKSCLVCSKTLFDIEYGDVRTWKEACGDFKGSWMWNILVFPTSEIQQCDHAFEVCRACTTEHMRGTLISGGPSACENLTCPQCRKKLVYNEIRALADSTTLEKYEKFLLQSYLSTQPSFRWCLAPLCTSGQLIEEDPPSPRITCEDPECLFEMCYTHEMPWHEGLTCDEFESQRDHGDRDFAATQEFVRSNTKPCPGEGCGVMVMKGEACFHMTCSQCNHQYCWQCLADWTRIAANGQSGHAEGCFFRTNNVRPTGLRGETLEAALAARA